MVKQRKCKSLSLLKLCEETRLPTMSTHFVPAVGDVYYTLVFKRKTAYSSQVFINRLNLLLDAIELQVYGHGKPKDAMVSGNSVQSCATFGVKKNTNTKTYV